MNMNLSYALFASLFLEKILGHIKVPRGPSEFTGNCTVCGYLILEGRGLFCANFWVKQSFFPRCDGIWCGKCYEAEREGDAFPVQLPIDEGGNVMEIRKTDADQFMYGRPGDHWMTTFQCDVCQFINVQGRDPCNTAADRNVIRCIRRATLDAFWSREPGTIAKNAGQLKLLDHKA